MSLIEPNTNLELDRIDHKIQNYIPLQDYPESFTTVNKDETLGVVQEVKFLAKQLCVLTVFDSKLENKVFIYCKGTKAKSLDLCCFCNLKSLKPLKLNSPLAFWAEKNQVLGKCLQCHFCITKSCRRLVKLNNEMCSFHILKSVEQARNKRMEFSVATSSLHVPKVESAYLYWIKDSIVSTIEARPNSLTLESKERKKFVEKLRNSSGGMHLREKNKKSHFDSLCDQDLIMLSDDD